MPIEPKKIILIDALALAYKAYFAFIGRPLKTKDGFPTSAIFGFILQLIKVLENIRPHYCVVAFDHKAPTFRHEMFPEYKSHREAMPDDMIPQIEKIKEILEALNIPGLILSGYEADDIIGTLARKAEAEGYHAYMITPDKDYVQLITNTVSMIKPGKSNEELNELTPEKTLQEYGFAPELMIDFLSLVGDASDFIPGVKNIGPGKALPLIKQYQTIENIYKHIDEIKPDGVRRNLIEGKESAFLSKRLVRIKTDVPIDFELEDAVIKRPQMQRLQQLFNELELKNPLAKLTTLYNELLEDESSAATDKDAEHLEIPAEHKETVKKFDKHAVHYHTVIEKADALKLKDKLMKCSEIVFDTETDSLDMFNLNIAGASFCMEEGEAYFIPIDPFGSGADLFRMELTGRMKLNDFISVFKPVFEKESIKKICQNGKYDIAVLRNYGVNVQGFAFDTMIAAYIIDADQKLNMDDLSEKYLNYRSIPLSDLLGKKKDASLMFGVPVQQLSDYAAEDADITFRLYQIFKTMLKEQDIERVAVMIDFPLVHVLEEMERTGIKLDTKSLKEFSKDLELQLTALTDKIQRLAGEPFNMNSPAQLGKILFEKLNLTPTKKTKTGYSTDAQSLETLRGEHPIIEEMLAYRQISKLKSTYTDALPELINPATGKIHTTFNQVVAATGRLSSLQPNLQNIPIRTELGKEIRKAFVPSDKNHILLSADYSQIELRIMASMSGDERMIKAFEHGEDIHISTAALVFNVPADKVTPDMRRKAKEVNFGIMYGIGPFGLKTRLGITQQAAKEIITTYFKTFPSVKAFIDECISFAREHEYAQTLTGRRRYLRNINSRNFTVKQFEERVAVNMPIQGTAADMIKLAMIRIHEYLIKNKFKSKMVLQVHDELVFDMLKEEAPALAPSIKFIMEDAMKLNVPLLVDVGTGANWLDAH
jgi:DNA polymerase-1